MRHDGGMTKPSTDPEARARAASLFEQLPKRSPVAIELIPVSCIAMEGGSYHVEYRVADWPGASIPPGEDEEDWVRSVKAEIMLTDEGLETLLEDGKLGAAVARMIGERAALDFVHALNRQLLEDGQD